VDGRDPERGNAVSSPADGGALLLRADALNKSYAGVRALEHVSFDLRAGEVHALVGENGAGKSTLIRILAGAVTADAGTLEIGGERIAGHDPQLALRRGISVIYQQPTLFPHLSVAENLAIGREAPSPWRRVDWTARREAARLLLERVGARIDVDRPARELSMAEQQMVEIARALGRQARIVIMDEPTASLTTQEVERLLAAVRELRARAAGVIYISHRLEEVFTLADRISVLRDGVRVATHDASAVSRGDVIRLMVGREMAEPTRHDRGAAGKRMLDIRGVTSAAAGIRDVSLSVRAGEIVGLGGLVGAGRTELAHTLFGLLPLDSGEIFIDDARVAIRRPQDAVDAGIAYVPEDRRRHGVIAQLRNASNLSLASLPRLAGAMGWLRRSTERSTALDLVRRLDVRPPSLDAATGTLSGGNQQKVAIGRWLMTEPRVLVLDEPTQGVDIGAKAEIHRHIARLASGGVAVLLISSDLPELLSLSDRILVLRGGRIAGALEGPDMTPEAVLRLALGEQAA
jgi:rhamnose transport system ATP-binding protein